MQLNESLVTPEEAVAIFERTSIITCLRANSVKRACFAAITPDLDMHFVLGCVWNAGRVQGIREERRRRKKGRGAVSAASPAKQSAREVFKRKELSGGRTMFCPLLEGSVSQCE